MSGQALGSPPKPDRASATRTSPALFRQRTGRAAPGGCGRNCRWHWRCKRRARRGRDRSARFSRWILRPARDPGGAAGTARILDALNGWINSLGRRDPELTGMGCTFTALVLRGRTAHVIHAGDTRAYRLRNDSLICLTGDHTREIGAARPRVLYRALGVETEMRLDYTAQPMALHDRFLLCSDGVHGFLTGEEIADILRDRSASQDTARALVKAALDAGSTDNCTALVLDVVRLPTAEWADIGAAIGHLPLIPVPADGETIDGFVLKAPLSDGRYTRLFAALDDVEGGEVALKFPKPQLAAAATYRAMFLREAWVGARA